LLLQKRSSSAAADTTSTPLILIVDGWSLILWLCLLLACCCFAFYLVCSLSLLLLMLGRWCSSQWPVLPPPLLLLLLKTNKFLPAQQRAIYLSIKPTTTKPASTHATGDGAHLQQRTANDSTKATSNMVLLFLLFGRFSKSKTFCHADRQGTRREGFFRFPVVFRFKKVAAQTTR